MNPVVRFGYVVVFLLAAAVPQFVHAEDALMQRAQALFKPLPESVSEVKEVSAGPEMIALGKALYFDPRLSQSHNISCNTCHQIGLGGVMGCPPRLVIIGNAVVATRPRF